MTEIPTIGDFITEAKRAGFTKEEIIDMVAPPQPSSNS